MPPAWETCLTYGGHSNKTLVFSADEIDELMFLRYGKEHTFVVLSLLYPTLDYRNKFHIDHIFPRSWFDKKVLKKKGIGADNIDDYMANRDFLGNLQLLEGVPNEEKSDTDFATWLNSNYKGEEKKEFMLTEWNPIDYTQGRFHLKAEAGKIYKGDVVGILGQNGIGKTTFVKILAGVIKTGTADANGNANSSELNLRVSYKPQYLEADDSLVMVALQRAIQKYDIPLIRPLTLRNYIQENLMNFQEENCRRWRLHIACHRMQILYLWMSLQHILMSSKDLLSQRLSRISCPQQESLQ